MHEDITIDELTVGTATTVLRVRGRLDARSAKALSSRCADVRRANRNLVLNLGGVTFIASSGIGALLAIVEEFRQSTAKVRVAELSPPVDSVIRLLNLNAFLSISPDEDHATRQLEAA